MPGRPSSTERARRLLTLLPYLEKGSRIPLSRLADVCGTDEATVTRDLTTLSMCGAGGRGPNELVCVYVEDDEAVVFGEPPALEEPVRLTGPELEALAAALEACGSSPGDPLLARLATAAASSGSAERLGDSIRAALAPGGAAATYTALVAAIADRRACEITYFTASRGEESVRIVHPLGLESARGEWYLRAWCESAREERTFRLDRITALKVTGARFESPAGPVTPTGTAPDTRGLPLAEVRFASDGPDLTEREWPGAVFEHQADGSVLARIPFAGTGWIARKVVARRGSAVVEGPSALRSAVAMMARELLEG